MIILNIIITIIIIIIENCTKYSEAVAKTLQVAQSQWKASSYVLSSWKLISRFS